MIRRVLDDEAHRERARSAWLRALYAHVRAAETHASAAALHKKTGHVERWQAELHRLSAQRDEFDAAVAMHPEWADAVPAWPKLETEAADG